MLAVKNTMKKRMNLNPALNHAAIRKAASISPISEHFSIIRIVFHNYSNTYILRPTLISVP